MSRVWALLLLALLLVISEVMAVVGLEITLDTRLESLSGPGWEARNIELRLTRGSSGAGVLQVEIEHLVLPARFPPLHGVNLHCRDFSLTADQVRCTGGQLRIRSFQGQPVSGRADFDYRTAEGALDFAIAELDLARGRVALRGSVGADAWRMNLNALAVDAAVLAEWLQTGFAWPLDAGAGQGRLALRASLSGQGAALGEARFRVSSQGLAFSAASGQYAAQDLGAQLEGSWQARSQGSEFRADLQLNAGQLYLNPVFWDISAQPVKPLTASVAGRLGDEHLDISRISLQHDQALRAQGALRYRLGTEAELERLDITVTEALFPAAYSHYLQPFLAGTVLGRLQTAGRASGQLSLAQGGIQALELRLIRLSLDDAEGRFGIEQLGGQVAWGQDTTSRRSRLFWQGGHLYRLEIGPANLALESRGGEFRLLDQGLIPLLDGTIIIDRLEGWGLGTGDLSWRFDGSLTPLSMESVSQALGWPPLSGRFSGEIPEVRYADQILEVDGSLRVRVFEGEIVVTNLRMERPFGVVPKVYADLDVRQLDLLTLTRTFDFGRITGTLEGQVRNLRLEEWEPVHFEAWFASPEQRHTRRQISQRAVRNLSALGGGGAGVALSRGFLGLFEEFNYKRLGISCRLVRGICEMDGIAPAGSGFYLVEGEGLPRIDVIGYNHRVDWDELLIRLKAAIQSEGPMVR